MTKQQLEEERVHHAKLDEMAGRCSARTQNDETHLGCAYCTYLVAFYGDPRMRLRHR